MQKWPDHGRDVCFHDPLIIPLAEGWLGLSTDLRLGGVQARTSPDMLEWSEPFPLLKDTPPSIRRRIGTDHFWAPEMVQRGGKWRLYCCASQPGKTQSTIGLAEADSPMGPFTYVGDVVTSQHSHTFTQANAIDPCVIADREGNDWLIYGSFFGGIRILPLGADGFPMALHEGKRIAGGGHRAVEGAYCCYHAESDRYVLFTSWGNLAVDYHIRVAYSKEIDGPYVDAQGFDMTDLDPNHHPGDKICGGYHFELPGMPGVKATGHNSLVQREDGLYMVHHARAEGVRRPPFLQARRVLFSDDGRVLAWPLPFDGHVLTPAGVMPENWRMVYLSRPNWGVVYDRAVTLAQLQAQRDGDRLTLQLFHKTWTGYMYQQGDRMACSLISEDGEALWGVAE